MTPLEMVTLGEVTGKIFQDENPEDPRRWDNLATFICFHRRYRLGDPHFYRHEDYSGWADFEARLLKADPRALILPLYLYDHSGITISTRPFGCPWDSGQIGFAMVPSKRLREEYQVKRITKRVRDLASVVVEGEVRAYDAFLRGDVYGFIVERKGSEADACWGFYEMEAAMEEMLAAMMAA